MTNTRARLRRLAVGTLVVSLAGLGAIAIPMSASAAIPAVISTADAGAGSLREAIVAANGAAGPDTITFNLPANSKIELDSPITITEGLAIDGTGAPGLVITGSTASPYVLLLVAPESAAQDFTFSDLIFDGTAATTPGWTGTAIYVSLGSNPVNHRAHLVQLTRITGRNITSPFSGAAFSVFALESGGTAIISGSTFTGNTSTNSSGNGGGALGFRGIDSTIAVGTSTFTNNTARSGGAIFAEGAGGGVATLNLTGDTFTGNKAVGPVGAFTTDGRGGAVAANFLSGFTSSRSTFSGNTALTDGGAVAIQEIQPSTGVVTLAQSTFAGNQADASGGAFFTSATQGAFNIGESTFSGNTLTGGAALGSSVRMANNASNASLSIGLSTFDEPGTLASYAISVQQTGTSALQIIHSTIVGPGAVGIGTLANSTSSVTHTILWSTVAASPDTALLAQAPGANTIAVSWNLSTGSALPQLAVGAGNHFGVTDFGLNALANNGGPTFTRLPTDSSPAHNDGNPAIALAPANDQRGPGFARIVQTIDIGAVELQTLSLAATGITVTPRLPLTGLLLILLGVVAVLYASRPPRRAH